ncbi:hypothetical protein KFE25_009185 [Diacronema lutheri]|uniref:Uncharacterized protein n=1 Tax=Diacronema lutheri TaxID=2081491 RepID=A0A8J5Y4I4_DIALT|nr:hypothetical protein KFE25_009185 [Diacronema lutheri]
MQRDDGRLLEEGTKQFSSGICACCSDADSCCLSCWCPCVQFGQNQERAFRSQHRTCCRWAMLWVTPLVVVWMLNTLLELATGRHQCKFFCHDEKQGLVEVDSSVDLSSLEVTKGCFEQCYPVFPRWVEAFEPFAWIVGCIVVAVLAGRRRALLRAQHRIRGSLEADIVGHCFCGCCSLAQEARHIAHEELVARQAEQNGVPIGSVAQPMPPVGYGVESATPTLAQPVAQPVYSLAQP